MPLDHEKTRNAKLGQLEMSVILDTNSLDLISHSADQTRRFGAVLGPLLRAGDILCLYGDLGTGKTCFVQGIAKGLEIEGPIRSPSFTLINEYYSQPYGIPVYHVDLYRLEDASADAVAIGLEDYLFGDGICLIEWADRAWEIMPAERLTVHLRYLDAFKRGILMHAQGDRPRALLEAYRGKIFGPAPARGAE